MALFITSDKPARRFLYIWFGITALLILLATYVVLDQRGWETRIATLKAEELKQYPQVQQQIAAARQQGMPDRQIQQQLLEMGMRQAVANVHLMKKSVFWSACIAAIAAFLFWFLLERKKAARDQKRFMLGGVLVIMLIQLLYVAYQYIQVEPFENIYTTPPDAIAKLQEQPKPFRIAVTDPGAYNMWVTLLFGLYDLECINVPSDSRPTPVRQKFFYNRAISPLRLWQYSNVKYVLGSPASMNAYLQSLNAQKDFKQLYSFSLGNQPQVIMEYTETLPRIFTVGTWVVKTNADEALEYMFSPLTDPHTSAVVMDTGIAAQTVTNFNGTVDAVQDYTPERLDTSVTLSSTGLVIMATEPAGGWTAAVDGVPQKIIRCNLLHQGIIVPPGTHTISFTYYQRHWTVALNNIMYAIVLPILIVLTAAYLVFIHMQKRKAKA
jgi:hypothetical protein